MVMKVAVVARFGNIDAKLLEHIKAAGLEYTDKEPEAVISYGGDGTFLIAERTYPGIPKLLLKDSKTCHKCTKHTIEDALQAIRKNTYKVIDYPKLRATVRNKELLGVNDIVIRNSLPTTALRFTLNLGEEAFEEELIGDGIVVATPFGSTGYYYSIAKKGFSHGFGLAFNNLTKDTDHFNFEEGKKLHVTIKRGEGMLAADNNPSLITVNAGDTILIKKAEETAKIITLH